MNSLVAADDHWVIWTFLVGMAALSLYLEQRFDLVRKIQFPEKGATSGYGLAFRVGKRGMRKTISHAGAVYGFASLFTCMPEEQLGVVVMNTVDCAGGINHKITSRAFDLMLAAKYGDEVPPLPKFITPTTLDPADYVGLDRHGNRAARVFQKEGQLVVNYGGADLLLRPVSPHSFLVDCRMSYGTSVDFLTGDKHEIRKVQIGNTSYERVPGYRENLDVPAKWSNLVGYYGWPHNTMKIFVRDGRLICLVEWFYEYPMAEERESTFRFPDYGLYSHEKLIFQKDAMGQIHGANMANVFFKRIGPL